MRPKEELKESENFAANSTGMSNTTASTEAVAPVQEKSYKAINPVTEEPTNKGFPSFYGSISG
jgi:hypothetical protein